RLYDPGHAHIFRRRRPPRLPQSAGSPALVVLPRPGLDLAHRLARAAATNKAASPAPVEAAASAAEVFAPTGLAAGSDHGFTSAAECVGRLFRAGRPLLLFMASGAAVRLLAPWLRGKSVDPPVVVVDDAGDYAVSLLGGRAAGANRLAEWAAAVLGARPVVTTAAERLGLPALDDALRHRGWRVAGGRLARLEGAVVNRETIAFYGPGLNPPALDGSLPAGAGRRRVRSLSSAGI